MKKVLITGSGSFIGGNFIRKAIYDQNQKKERSYSFASVDRITANNTANAVNSLYWNKNHKFYPADIRDQHVMDVIFQIERPDIVISWAAETHVDNSLTDPNSFVTSNVLGTQVLINCCVKHKVKRLIYCSTDEVMGQLTSENESSWTEIDIPNPRNPYAASKYCGEVLIKAANVSFGLNYNITRSSNCYGPHQTCDKLIPKAIKCILDGKLIPIYGQGLQIRDWTHVIDNVNAMQLILDKAPPNEIYNISANQEFSNIEVIHEICKYMGKNTDSIQFITDPRGNAHDFRYSVNSSKIRELGWAPTMQFKKDIGENCVDWYIANRHWAFL
jgi:dTDP-glucose 4,6-dehydratase